MWLYHSTITCIIIMSFLTKPWPVFIFMKTVYDWYVVVTFCVIVKMIGKYFLIFVQIWFITFIIKFTTRHFFQYSIIIQIKTWIFFPLHSVISYLQFTTQREVFLLREMACADCFYQISYCEIFILSVICAIWISSLYSICQLLYHLVFSWFIVPLYEPSVILEIPSLDDLIQLHTIEGVQRHTLYMVQYKKLNHCIWNQSPTLTTV